MVDKTTHGWVERVKDLLHAVEHSAEVNSKVSSQYSSSPHMEGKQVPRGKYSAAVLEKRDQAKHTQKGEGRFGG